MARLKSYLALYSVKVSSNMPAKKAIEMCVSRYLRGPEKNRMEAVKLFQSYRSCEDYMHTPMEEVLSSLPAALDSSIIVLDDE